MNINGSYYEWSVVSIEAWLLQSNKLFMGKLYSKIDNLYEILRKNSEEYPLFSEM